MAERSFASDTEQVEALRRQIAVLSEFGKHAVQTDNLDALLHEALTLISDAIKVDLVKVLELLPDGQTLLVRAGVHWGPGIVGKLTVGTREASPAGYALLHDAPVISRDIATETRFEIPAVLLEYGVKSTVSVIIRGDRSAFGVLEVDARQHRDFGDDDVAFLQNYANLLAAAIDRLEAERELAKATETRTILFRELQHRVKNLLANIQALARRTSAASADLDAFVTAFDGRLAALTRAQDLLTRGPEEAADLRDILCQELKAHGAQDERFTLHGPDTPLSPKVAQALGMAFHELATNAVKYGALGADSGRLDVGWATGPSSEGDQMLIRWRERGIRIDTTPSRRGLGSEMIESSLPYMFGGSSTLIFHPDGAECVIRLPIANL